MAAFAGNDIANLLPVAYSAFRPLRIQARAGRPLAFRVTPNPERILARGAVAFELRPPLPGDVFSDRRTLPTEGGTFLCPWARRPWRQVNPWEVKAECSRHSGGAGSHPTTAP